MAHTVTMKKAILVNGSVVAIDSTAEFDYGTAKALVQKGLATWTDPRPLFEDFGLTKDEIEALCRLRTDPLLATQGAAAAATALALGRTIAEGYQFKVIDETISHASNAALTKNLTNTIPAGSVILAVQGNVEAALTGGGTTVKFGIGTAADPDKFGLGGALTKNTKVNTIPTHAILASAEQILVAACATAGAAGDTALTVGSVRVRVVYAQPVNLADAD